MDIIYRETETVGEVTREKEVCFYKIEFDDTMKGVGTSPTIMEFFNKKENEK